MSVEKKESYKIESVILSQGFQGPYRIEFRPHAEDSVSVWYRDPVSDPIIPQFSVPARDIRDLASALIDLADYIDSDEVPF